MTSADLGHPKGCGRGGRSRFELGPAEVGPKSAEVAEVGEKDLSETPTGGTRNDKGPSSPKERTAPHRTKHDARGEGTAGATPPSCRNGNPTRRRFAHGFALLGAFLPPRSARNRASPERDRRSHMDLFQLLTAWETEINRCKGAVGRCEGQACASPEVGWRLAGARRHQGAAPGGRGRVGATPARS